MTEKKQRATCFSSKSCKIFIEEDKKEQIKDKDLKLILGFLGVGLVGNIVTSELIDQLEMEEIGFIVSEDLPAMALFVNGELKKPFRIYYSEKNKLIVAQCEVPFNKSETYSDLARLIIDWSIEFGIKLIGCIQGIAIPGIPEEHPVYTAAVKKMLPELQKDTEIQTLERGIVMGAEAALLNECLINGLDCYALLTPVNAQIPSPSSAAAVIKQMNILYSLAIDTKKLIEDDQKIKEKLMELNRKTQEQHAQLDLKSPGGDNSRLYL